MKMFCLQIFLLGAVEGFRTQKMRDKIFRDLKFARDYVSWGSDSPFLLPPQMLHRPDFLAREYPDDCEDDWDHPYNDHCLHDHHHHCSHHHQKCSHKNHEPPKIINIQKVIMPPYPMSANPVQQTPSAINQGGDTQNSDSSTPAEPANETQNSDNPATATDSANETTDEDTQNSDDSVSTTEAPTTEATTSTTEAPLATTPAAITVDEEDGIEPVNVKELEAPTEAPVTEAPQNEDSKNDDVTPTETTPTNDKDEDKDKDEEDKNEDVNPAKDKDEDKKEDDDKKEDTKNEENKNKDKKEDVPPDEPLDPNAAKCKDPKIDLGFVIDGSGTDKCKTDWTAIKLAVKQFAERFEISTDGSRGAVVVFGKDASKDNAIKFDNGLSNEKLGKKIMELPFPNDKERRIDLGLSFVESELFQDGKGERRKILILITDGAQVPTNPMDASGKLIESGVVIYVLAVGDKIDRAQLNKIAHVSDRVYPTENFGKLRDKDFADDVTSMICKEEETIA